MTFEELYERFRKPVWRLARRLTANDEEALDASQEIFLRVWKGLSGFRGEAKLSTWVFQIAWNYLRGYRRSKGRQLTLVTGSANDSEQLVARVPDPGPGPERKAAAVELLARVGPAIHQLAEGQRVVLWLRDGEGLSYEEIAEALDIPIGTVRSRLARARRALKRAVEA